VYLKIIWKHKTKQESNIYKIFTLFFPGPFFQPGLRCHLEIFSVQQLHGANLVNSQLHEIHEIVFRGSYMLAIYCFSCMMALWASLFCLIITEVLPLIEKMLLFINFRNNMSPFGTLGYLSIFNYIFVYNVHVIFERVLELVYMFRPILWWLSRSLLLLS
jgi:hypothetical protein